MCRKTLGMLLLGAAPFLYSCVDDTYDLANKEISTDVEIKGNKLALPLGSLRTVLLDSLISVEELDILTKMDGVYSISMADTIAPYQYEIPEIKFTIPAQEANVKVDDFAEAEISEIHIEGQSPESTQFGVDNISLDDLKIPNLITEQSVSAANKTVNSYIGQLDGKMDDVDVENWPTIPFDETFKLEEGTVSFNMGYQLPEEIKSISTIWLKTAEESADSQHGALIGFEIEHPVALQDLKKKIDFTITFPDEFVVSLDPTTTDGTYSLEGQTITVSNLSVNAGVIKNTVIRFYIDRLQNLDDKIADGKLSLDESIIYSVDYTVEGDLKFKKEFTLESFDFKVHTDLELAFRDVEGETNDIEVEFSPIEMPFNVDFDNLQYIDRIEYIDFDATRSVLHFHTEMEGGFEPFSLKEGYALKLDFPDELIIDDEHSNYPRTTLDGEMAVEYKADEHAFYIYNLEVFNNLIEDEDEEGNPVYYHWALALDRMDLHEDVENGVFHHEINAKLIVVNNNEATDRLVLAGTHLESLSNTLESLKSKEATFRIWNADFYIDDAVVHSEKIISDIKHTENFEFENNDLPKEIRRVETIGFEENTPMDFTIEINGLEDLDTHATLDLHVKLPSALKVKPGENSKDVKNLEIIGDSLLLVADINPKSETVVKLQCEGFDFTKGQEGKKDGIRTEVRNDKGYIKYNSDIAFVGAISIEGSDFHAAVLDKDISVNVGFSIGDIKVKDFGGIFYIDDLGEIEESFDLNLGENLEFLQNEENTIVLSDPQISITVDNSISIPILANLSLTGKDANGQVIETSKVETTIHIDAAEYNEEDGTVTPRSTKLLITAHPMEKDGYKNCHVENLGNLLKQFPASMDIVLIPVIDTLNTQYISLVQPLSFSGNYSVDIPFRFDELSFVYSDTISDLKVGLGETMEMFSNVKLGLNMNVKNSLPLQLQLKAVPLDEFGGIIHGLTISELDIPAGSGSAFSDTIAGKTVNFSIESRSVNDISALDKLKFDVHATATSTVGGATLRCDQGIKLEDIVIEVAGDISTNLSE